MERAATESDPASGCKKLKAGKRHRKGAGGRS